MKFKIEKDVRISFIVPVYKVKEDTLKRCLLSLKDQDYPNIEVIVVYDGPDKDLERVFDDFAEPNFIKVIQPHGGACSARNRGFKESTGDIVSFFNSDYILNPGIARLWVEKLQSNKEYGFLYGPYGYFASRAWYQSKPFDKFLLTQANYIDCGFPLWRQYVVEWDTNCKSLQDWDFWLRVIKTHDVKGYYLQRDVSFIAEMPRKGGLSMDSSQNWVDRVKYVREKNGIPSSDLLVTSIGAANHGKEIAKMLKADFRDDTIFKPHDYKSLYMIGWYMKPNDVNNQHPQIMAHMMKTKKIVHFVGADIFWLRKFPWEGLKLISETMNSSVDHILCENEQSQKELDMFGIKADIVPIPPYGELDVSPLPKEFKVAIMITEKSDFDKYLTEHMLSIIRAMPDIKFVVYGGGAINDKYPNMENLGLISRDRYERMIKETSCLLRVCRHDTVPMSSCEYFMAGRDVISNIHMPFVNYIDTSGKEVINTWDKFGPGFNEYRWPQTKADIVKMIRDVKRFPKTNKYRYSVSDHYKSVYDKRKYVDEIYRRAGLIQGAKYVAKT